MLLPSIMNALTPFTIFAWTAMDKASTVLWLPHLRLAQISVPLG